MTLLARKGYTLSGNILLPIEDVIDESPVNSHPSEMMEADDYGREVKSLAIQAVDPDTTGRSVVTESVTVIGVPRQDADHYQPVIEALAAEANRTFFDVANADADVIAEGESKRDSVWVEGELMGLVKLIDDTKTAWYHAKLLNVYFDKSRGKLATGSVRFTVSPAGLPAFYCVRPGCECQHAFEGFMGNALDFLYLAFTHGINHGANFGRPYNEVVLNDPYMPEVKEHALPDVTPIVRTDPAPLVRWAAHSVIRDGKSTVLPD